MASIPPLLRSFLSIPLVIGGLFVTSSSTPQQTVNNNKPADKVELSHSTSTTSLRNLEPSDLLKIKIIDDSQIAPNGNFAVFVQREVDQAHNASISRLYTIDTTQPNAKPQPLTEGPADAQPRFFADGRLIVFTRAGQLWIIPSTGGTATQLTNYQDPIFEVAPSPDGKSIAFTALVKENGLVPAVPTPPPDSGIRDVWGAGFKAEGIGESDRQIHIFTYNCQTKEVRQLTRGNYNCATISYTLDGKKILCSANLAPTASLHPNTSQIYAVDVEGNKKPVKLTPGKHHYSNPTDLGNGDMAFTGTEDDTNWQEQPGLFIRRADGTVGRLTNKNYCIGDAGETDLHVPNTSDTPCLGPDGKIYVNCSDSGNNYILAVDPKSIDPITKESVSIGTLGKGKGLEHEIYQWTMSKTGRLLMAYTTPTIPNDLALMDIRSPKFKPITAINSDSLKNIRLSSPIALTGKSQDGTIVHGWVLPPPDAQNEKEARAGVEEVHGGDMLSFQNGYWFERHLLAAQGYTVIYGNPRGSEGYGEAFSVAIRGKWGSLDVQDLDALMVAAVKEGYVDPNRLGMTGHSYGGFITTYVATHPQSVTYHLKAGVARSAVTEWSSFVEASDEGRWPVDDSGFTPTSNPTFFTHISPVNAAKDCSFPLQLQQGDGDLRVPDFQERYLREELAKNGKIVESVRFPVGGHGYSWIGPPSDRVFSYAKTIEWFTKWIPTHPQTKPVVTSSSSH